MYYKHLSDIEDLSVEWENDLGHRWWQCFTTAEEMNKVLRANEAYNNQPDVKAAIEADLKAQNEWLVEMQLEPVLEQALIDNRVVDVTDIYESCHWTAKELDHALNILAEHNKRVLATKDAPTSTFKLGELLKNINLTIG